MSTTTNRVRITKKDKFVSSCIMGGLGNQLFILFAGYSHAIDNDVDFIVDPVRGNRRKYYFDTPLYKNLKINRMRAWTHREVHHHYDALPAIFPMKIHGYFQSWKYFDKNKDEIIKRLELDNLRKEIYDKYEHYQHFDVMLHFRLGDYKKNHPHNHPICDIEYYKAALKNFDEDSKVLYFFEEGDRKEVNGKIEILRGEYPNMKFTPIDTSIVDYEQMFIMSNFKNFIIANSTFSWWGAYLSTRDDKKIVYPEKWFGPRLAGKKVHDLFMDDWIKV